MCLCSRAGSFCICSCRKGAGSCATQPGQEAPLVSVSGEDVSGSLAQSGLHPPWVKAEGAGTALSLPDAGRPQNRSPPDRRGRPRRCQRVHRCWHRDMTCRGPDGQAVARSASGAPRYQTKNRELGLKKSTSGTNIELAFMPAHLCVDCRAPICATERLRLAAGRITGAKITLCAVSRIHRARAVQLLPGHSIPVVCRTSPAMIAGPSGKLP